MPNSPLLMMAILIVMAIAVVVVIAMTLKLNQEVRNLAEDVEIDRQNLAKLNHEVGKRLGAPRPRGAQRPPASSVPPQGQLTIYGRYDGWYSMGYGNLAGYVRSEYVRL